MITQFIKFQQKFPNVRSENFVGDNKIYPEIYTFHLVKRKKKKIFGKKAREKNWECLYYQIDI